ncbi:alpha/beta fold hydrolase [Rhizorhabdus argentea]|uniref:alpha/beta fold hydrolase n=1 Tax=Rhizorhabdus argentea TaxID=1387174 RepID=UPI0030EDC100
MLESLDSSARRFATASGEGSIIWREWGNGPPLVLIHGGFGSWRHWVRNIPSLAERFLVLAPDLPGMGDSDPVTERDTPGEIVTALSSGLVQILGANRHYNLAGFSFGGMIAGALAQADRERVLSLALVAPICLATGRPRPEVMGLRGLVGTERRAAHRCNLMSTMFADPRSADDLALEVQEQNHLRVRATSFALTRRPFLRDMLPGISPVPHFIWGGRDNFSADYMDENVAIVRAARPDATVEIVPHAGHWLPYERAESVTAFLCRYSE